WLGPLHIDTSRPPPPSLPFARSTRPSAGQDRHLPVPFCDARTFRRFVDQAIPRLIASGFVARAKSPSLCPCLDRGNFPPVSIHRFSWTLGPPRLYPDGALR